MKTTMPQEIEVWYLIPSLRREMAQILVEKHNLNQKKTAEILGITESAVSQYLKSKRGSEVKFSKEDLGKIEKATEKIVRNRNSMKAIYDLCVNLRKSRVVCDIHKNQDKNVPSDCNICFEK